MAYFTMKSPLTHLCLQGHISVEIYTYAQVYAYVGTALVAVRGFALQISGQG
jgi:hypothetical protein